MDGYTTANMTLQELKFPFEVVIDKEYGKVLLLPNENIMICELFKEYVPIEEFKEIFTETIPLIKQYGVKKFIFDKRNLRVFHQPSMEWYFIEWKKEIFNYGLKIHRKILPQDEPAFALAVEAGRAKIRREYPDNIIDQLDIQYKTTIQEAIES